MRISAEWLEEAPNAAPEECATACDLRIWVGGANVTSHIEGDDAPPVDHVTLPAYSLAEGMAHGWWRIFGGRDHEYALIRHRMGYAVPDIRFRFDGSVFEIAVSQRSYANPNIRFWSEANEVLDRARAEAVLSGFIDETVLRLDTKGLGRTGAGLRWARVKASRQDPEEAAFCEAAGAMGLDPYGIGEDDAAFIERAAGIFDGEPLLEFLAGAPRRPARNRSIDWIEAAEGRPSDLSRFPALDDVASASALSAPARIRERSWALGYRRARAARAALGMRDGIRVKSVGSLATLFEARHFVPAPPVDGLRALVSRRRDGVHIHLRDHGSSSAMNAAQIFALGRALGEAVCFPGDGRVVVNDLHDAARQAAGRAFAAEFLAPVREVRSMRESGRDEVSIADEFGVAPEVVTRQIENAHRIEQACG